MGKPNIVLLVCDSLRFDYVDPSYDASSNTPNIQELIREGLYLEDVYSTGSWTVPAHGSLFTGTLPSENGIGGANRQFDSPPSLADVLSTAGYNTMGVSTNPWITHDFGFDSGFNYFESHFPSPRFDSEDPRTKLNKINADGDGRALWELAKWALSENRIARIGNTVERYLTDELPYVKADELTNVVKQTLKGAESPFFLFVNYMDAHEPYTGESSLSDQIHWNLESVSTPPANISDTTMSKLYAEDVRFLDNAIGSFIDHLKQQNLYDDTLLLLLSDHGQALGEHQYWGHGTFLYESLVKVPVVLKPPKGATLAQDSSATMSLIDIHDLVYEIATTGAIDSAGIPSRNYVVAESFGAHESVDSVDVPDAGYRALATDSGYGILNLESQEFEHCAPDTAAVRRTLQCVTKSEEELLDPLVETATTGSVDADVAERLEQLGYK